MLKHEPGRGILNVGYASLAALLFNISLMSAFPESGRSDTPKSGKTKVRFRPLADVKFAY